MQHHTKATLQMLTLNDKVVSESLALLFADFQHDNLFINIQRIKQNWEVVSIVKTDKRDIIATNYFLSTFV